MKLGWAILGWALTLGGCSVYDYRYVFEPDPRVVETPVAAGGSLTARVSVLGLRESPSPGNPGPVVAVRLHLENASRAAIDFEPRTLVLLSGDRTPFGAPIGGPTGRRSIDPGGVLMVEAAFPLLVDARDIDWSALSVQWTVHDGAAKRVAADFTREPRAYFDRYPNRIGVGFMRFDTK